MIIRWYNLALYTSIGEYYAALNKIRQFELKHFWDSPVLQAFRHFIYSQIEYLNPMNRNVLMLVALSWPLVAPLLSAGQQRGVDNRMIRYALQDQREWRAKQLPTNSVLYKQQYSKIFSGQLLRPEKQIENFMNPVINKNTENAYRASTASFPVFFDQGSNQLHPTIQDNFLGTNFKRRSGNSYSKWNKQFLSIQ